MRIITSCVILILAAFLTGPLVGQESLPAASPSSAPASQPAAQPSNILQTGQHARSLKKTLHESIDVEYLLYLPEAYGRDAERNWPVIVFLHGSGERGNIKRTAGVGLPKRLQTDPDYPFIVISPLCPAGKWWTDTDMRLAVMALLDDTQETLAADPARVYLTGLSMGGFGTWDLAQQYPGRFAAIAPVCGGGNPYLQQRLKNVPAMVFHGARDQAVPLAMGKQMAGALQAIGGAVQMIVYPDMGHQIWDQAYAGTRLTEFFLQHKLRQPAQP
jgi:predicted peptidase